MRTWMLATLAVCSAALPGVPAVQEVHPNRTTIRGTWKVVAYDQDGKPAPAAVMEKLRVVIQADQLTIKPRLVAQHMPVLKDGKRDLEVTFRLEAGQSDEIAYKLDAAKSRIDLLGKDRGVPKVTRGVCVLEGDTLKICFPLADRKPPKTFPDQPKTGFVRIVLQRLAS